MKLTRSLIVGTLALIGAAAQTHADVSFTVSNRIARKCDLVQSGETILLNVYIYPDYYGVLYEGPMTGMTSGGVPVFCYGTVSLGRRGITIDADTLTIGDACAFTNMSFRGTYIFSGF